MRRVVGIRSRSETQQAHSRFCLGLQFWQNVLTPHDDRAGFRVQATARAEYRRRTTVGDPNHHRLALANGDQRGIDLGLRAELLRAVGTADQGQADDSDQTKQQAMQHAHLSMGVGRKIALQYNQPHHGLTAPRPRLEGFRAVVTALSCPAGIRL